MIRNTNTLEEDQLLKQHALRPRGEVARFNWAEVVSEQRPINLKLTSDGEERDLSPAEVAEIVGDALTTLLLSRKQE